ncbi:hypothetical protein LZP73_03030 [Shewanella sp. AS16]|uniref:hypothetical protein n=1 Tax=Shewanella sp. AS16 TaxID=2907625 RepID=UPI001F157AF1|nr:hypothetical protein [Shewanella sp. AS16]MCE9685187.1 hypothetical protein [Shewanella sp. AS16]
MFNLKSVFALVFFSSLCATAVAGESEIDMQSLHAAISQDIAISLQQLQETLTQDVDSLLVAEQAVAATQVAETSSSLN